MEVAQGAVRAGTQVSLRIASGEERSQLLRSLPKYLEPIGPEMVLKLRSARTYATGPVTIRMPSPHAESGSAIAAIKPEGATNWHLLLTEVVNGEARITTDRFGDLVVFLRQLCGRRSDNRTCSAPGVCREAVCVRESFCDYPVVRDGAACDLGSVCCAGECTSLTAAQPSCQPLPAARDFVASERPCRPGDESLAQYAERCDRAMGGVSVDAFDCDDPEATEVMHRFNDTWDVPNDRCAAPNVLNGVCDPGSRFRVLHRNVANDGIYIVAHCRKELTSANGPDSPNVPEPNDVYGDIAVIQYNANTGATCFYQALAGGGGGLRHDPPAPRSDDSFWLSPAATANINCGGCHDTGPFIRSPYLAQLGQVWPFGSDTNNPLNPNPGNPPIEDKNYLPGTLDSDVFGDWNSTMPYSFTGLNFQHWVTHSVSVSGNPCTSCHRLGYSNIGGKSFGTAVQMGLVATNQEQGSAFNMNKPTRKRPHDRYSHANKTSPIWMMPSNFKHDPVNSTNAQEMRDCAVRLLDGEPGHGCSSEVLAVGDTCPPPSFSIPAPGGNNPDNPWQNNGKETLGDPTGRPGFYFFTELHGPFYQDSPWDDFVDRAEMWNTSTPWVPPTTFQGTYLRLYVEGNPPQWTVAWGVNATSIQNSNNAPPPPGWPWGKIDGVAFEQIDSVPNPANCNSGGRFVSDPDGSNAPLSETMDNAQGASAAILAGFIGNVSRSTAQTTSLLRIDDVGGNTVLLQEHENSVTTKQVFGGQAWANRCADWEAGAHYYPNAHKVKVKSGQNVLLVPKNDVADTICYLDGIGGDWSIWGPRFTSAHARIYIDPDGWRFEVSGADPTGHNPGSAPFAFATCLLLKK